MIDFMNKKAKWDLIPSNILSVGGEETSDFILQYNDLVLQRNRVVKDGTPKNSIVINLDQKLRI